MKNKMKKIKEDIIYITEYENKNIAINFSLEEFNDYINSNIQEKQLFINKKI